MRPSPTESTSPAADHGLGHVGQPLLEVGVARTDQHHLGSGSFQLGGEVQQAGDADERVFGRLVPVGGREQGRALHVGTGVRAPGGDAHQRHAERSEQVEQGERLGEVDPRAAAVAAERIGVGPVGPRLGLADPVGSRPVGHHVGGAEPHADLEARRRPRTPSMIERRNRVRPSRSPP
jgi:hypothetical protein